MDWPELIHDCLTVTVALDDARVAEEEDDPSLRDRHLAKARALLGEITDILVSADPIPTA